VLSIASYLLGIGDRHLENFLISTTDGEVLGIDYGCAFGFGVQLAVPELIPFRLTQQIEGVIAPHPMNSVYQQTMVHVMRALRKNKSLILDTCDIFVKEPLLDWMQTAKRKQQRFYNSKQTAEELEEQLSFYPKQKIEVLRNKLDGYNPVYIVHNELKESSHYKLTYYERLLEALQGPEGGFRERLLKDKVKYLEVEKQVECLIDLARCPDILGRAWIGWQAFI
jgi:DNA-dependent protein kinase catalytic subunit